MRPVVRLVVVASVALLATVLPARAANDPGAAQQWNMSIVGAETAWAAGTGTGVTVAVVDTGVSLGHEDLVGRIVSGWSFVEDNDRPQDDDGHGTHVAGIVGASANNGKGVIGVGPDIRIMPVRVLHGPDGTGTGSDVEAGIRWAADHGARVINLSLGEDLQGLQPFGPTFVDALEYAWTKGAVCVVAAGNDTLQSSGFDSATNAVVVTATTREDAQAGYASDVGFLFKNPKWGMAAPGGAGTDPPDEDDILSTYWTSATPSAYAHTAGTSMATPHVSGALALLLSAGQTREQAIQRVTTTAKDLGPAGRDNRFGWGRLDVAKAVAGLAPAGGGTTTTVATTGGPGTTTTTGRRTTTTTRSSGRLAIVTPTSEGPRTAGGNDTTSTSPGSPDLPDEAGAADEGAAGGGREDAAGPASNDDSEDTVWLAGLLALAALVAVTAGAVRARRLRV